MPPGGNRDSNNQQQQEYILHNPVPESGVHAAVSIRRYAASKKLLVGAGRRFPAFHSDRVL
jgi:hypothetical protein